MLGIKKIIFISVIIFLVMLLIAGSLMAFGNHTWESVRMSFSMIILFFLPGFTWSWVLFEPKSMAVLVRIAFSIVLSVGLVPTSIIFAHALKMKVTTASTVAVTVTLILAGISVRIFMHRSRRVSKMVKSNAQ